MLLKGVRMEKFIAEHPVFGIGIMMALLLCSAVYFFLRKDE